MTNKSAYTLLTATFLSLTCALPVFAESSTTTGSSTTASATNSSNATVAKVGRGLDKVTTTANTAKSATDAASSVINTKVSVDNIGTTAKTAVKSTDTIMKSFDQIAGTKVTKSSSGTMKEATEAANDLSGMQDTYTKIANGDISIKTGEEVLKGADSLGKTFDKWTGLNTSSDITELTGDGTKILGSVEGTMKTVADVGGTVSALMKQGDKLAEFVSDPKQLSQMAMSMAWSQVEEVSKKVAEDLITSLFSTPGTGIPVTASNVTTQKKLAQAQKKLTGELEDDIAKEKDKILKAMGGNPAVAADPQTGTNQTDNTQQENPGRENCPAYMAQFKPITNLAFDFVNENMIKDIKNEQTGKVQTNWDEAVKYVKSTFYHDDATTLTPEINKELIKKRQDYLHEINSNLLSVSIGMQQALIEDAKSISTAPTSGCGFIDDVNINTQTMIALTKQTMAEIALEIRLFELEAIAEQTKQPIYLLPKPEDASSSQDKTSKVVASVNQAVQSAADLGTSK